MSDFTETATTDTQHIESFSDTIASVAKNGVTKGLEQTDLVLGIANVLYDSTQRPNQAIVNDRAVYKNIASKSDGTKVSAAVTLTTKSDQGLTVNLSGGLSNEILLNIYNDPSLQGALASFTLEFFVPSQSNSLTGEPVSVNSIVAQECIDDINGHLQMAAKIEQMNLSPTPVANPKRFGKLKAQFWTPYYDTDCIEFTLEAKAERASLSLSGLVLPRDQMTTALTSKVAVS